MHGTSVSARNAHIRTTRQFPPPCTDKAGKEPAGKRSAATIAVHFERPGLSRLASVTPSAEATRVRDEKEGCLIGGKASGRHPFLAPRHGLRGAGAGGALSDMRMDALKSNRCGWPF